MNKGLFRKQALSSFLRPDIPGTVLTVAPPTSVAVFVALTALFAALAVLGAATRITVYAEGRGVVRPDAPAIVLRAPFTGTIASVGLEAGSHGRAGDPVLVF